jgi:internalin A
VAGLELAGAIKAGEDGQCVIRNRVYETAFRGIALEDETAVPGAGVVQQGSVRKNVFVSYSHRDGKYLDRLRVYLKPLRMRHEIVIWDDTQLQPGQRWREAIQEAIAGAAVAVLLVSQDFIASDFIDKDELPPILSAAKSKGLTILWVPLSSSSYKDTPIALYQAVCDPARPLDGLTDAELNAALLKIYNATKNALGLDVV